MDRYSILGDLNSRTGWQVLPRLRHVFVGYGDMTERSVPDFPEVIAQPYTGFIVALLAHLAPMRPMFIQWGE